MISQAFGEKNMSRTQQIQTHQDRKRRQVKGTVKGVLIIFFHIKGIVLKEFILASQTVSSAYYCDMLWRLRENVQKLWQQKNWLLHYDNTLSHTSVCTREFFTKSNRTVVHHAPYSPLFTQLKIKLKGCHSDTTVIKAEWHMVLNTFTEHDFQDAFKKWQKRWKRCIRAEGDYFKGDGDQ
jgi:hypothetical protein